MINIPLQPLIYVYCPKTKLFFKSSGRWVPTMREACPFRTTISARRVQAGCDEETMLLFSSGGPASERRLVRRAPMES